MKIKFISLYLLIAISFFPSFIFPSNVCSSVNKTGNLKDSRGVPEWYLNGRFGIFYHWGARSSGYGASGLGKEKPFSLETIEQFEEGAPEPEELAKKLVDRANRVGAKYITFTILHSIDRYTVLYPTKLPHFLMKTNKDYVGAIIKEAHSQGIKFIAYMSTVPGHYNSQGGPYMNGLTGSGKSEESTEIYMGYIIDLLTEMKERYANIGGIDGVWIDGSSPNTDFEAMAEVLPDAVLIGNNLTRYPHKGQQIAALEGANADPEPAYNRPSVHRIGRSDRFQPPLSDYCEDIPSMGKFSYSADIPEEKGAVYANDSLFWVREMICSLGQRRKWNHTMGIGPKLSGDFIEKFEPSISTMARFMKWASPAIYNTMGGEGAPLQQGWMNDGAFGSIMVSLNEENTYYLFVTTAPDKNYNRLLKAKKKNQDVPVDDENQGFKNVLILQHYWVEVESIIDFRTGKPQGFEMDGSINLIDVDWSDVNDYGAKVFKIKLK
jgi:hypothetical protein